MSSAQQSFLDLLERFGKPDIDTAKNLLEHAKDLRLPPRMIDLLKTFIERQKDAGAKAEASKQASDAATGAWTNVKESAKKRDDLVSLAEDLEREREDDDPMEKVRTLLEAVAPTAVEYYCEDVRALTDKSPMDYAASLPVTTNEKKPSLRGLLEAAIELIKHDLHGDLIDEINTVLEDWLGRCESGVTGAKTNLIEATQRKKTSAREILAAIAPVELDILEGSDVNEAGPEELAFAHACWTYWDEKLTTAATGSAIVKAIEAKRTKTNAESATSNEKEPEGLKGLDRAREQGRQACIEGKGEEANPYQKANYRDAWDEGWHGADREGLRQSATEPVGAKA
jgi:ribosome modulation factor